MSSYPISETLVAPSYKMMTRCRNLTTLEVDKIYTLKCLNFNPSSYPSLSCALKALIARRGKQIWLRPQFVVPYILTRLNLRNPLAVVVNALTMTVGNVNDAPLEMNALAIKDMRLTLPELQTRILYHYRQEILRQLYRILGSADFIGNPVGLFTNVSSGAADIFYEPFQGVVMHGNRELGIGLAKVFPCSPLTCHCIQDHSRVQQAS